MQASPNFTFLQKHDYQLVLLGTLAESYFKEDPNTCLIKLRQFGELLAQLVAANFGLLEERVDKAMGKILSSRSWSQPQLQELRISN